MSFLSFILGYFAKQMGLHLAQTEQNDAHTAEMFTDICRSPHRQPLTARLTATVHRRKASDRCLLQRASTSVCARKNHFKK